MGRTRSMVWTAARLRRMTLAEVPFRLRAVAVGLADRRWRPPDPPPGTGVRWPVPLSLPIAPWPSSGGAGTDSERAWPRARRLDLLGSGLDPRDAWEETRLHALALRALAGDVAAVGEARAFLGEAPPGIGIAWAVPMEAAIRLVSLALIAAVAPDEHASGLRAAIAAHAAWIARHPSRGTSANNHRVAELGALALAGRVLGDAPLGRLAARELPAVLRAQIHPDGAGVEQSPSYLAFDLEWALLARLCGVDGLEEPMDRAAAFLCALLDGGRAPRIGDDDGGRVIAVGPAPEPGYVASVAGAVRASLGRPVPPGWAPDLRAALLGAPAAEGVEAPRSASFPAGGLTVLRCGPAAVVVDHGPLGEPALGAHGHADAASVWVSLDGAPVVVDRGVVRYNADPVGRRFDRGTGAHPTVLVDGVDQSVPHDHPFLWRSRAEAVAEQVDLVGRRVVVRVDGAPHGVVHRRTVALHPDRLLVTDELTGTGTRHVAVQFPLDPGIEAEMAGAVVLSRAGAPVATLRGTGTARLVRGGPRPGLGWHAVGYGVAVEAPAVIFELRGRLPLVHRAELAFPAGGEPG